MPTIKQKRELAQQVCAAAENFENLVRAAQDAGLDVRVNHSRMDVTDMGSDATKRLFVLRVVVSERTVVERK